MSLLRRRILSTSECKDVTCDESVKTSVGECKLILEKNVEQGTFWLTRVILLRYIAFIYFVAFLVAYNQNEALIGKNGLLPGDLYLNYVRSRTSGGLLERLQYAPSIIWFFDYENCLNNLLNGIALTGLITSGLVMFFGSANIFVMLFLWILYHSIVSIGQRWYSFGWESQLLETGFLATFLCPLLACRQFSGTSSPPFLVILCFRWLIFRIMLGAGLIKLRGDKCWLDLTCMHYHYETQPVPNPLSYYMHQEPGNFHKFETLVNHFIELLAPFLLLMPRRLSMIGGFLQILFQVILILSGNLSFLNWLTIAPSLACFDDASLSWMFSASKRKAVVVLQCQSVSLQGIKKIGCRMRKIFDICFVIMIAYLSIPIVQNLLSARQVMNTSFDPLRIVNTYGAFGSITKERTEVIFEGTHSKVPDDPNAKWMEYEFKCKPGLTRRRPCLISPYHYRLDWLMWFAAFQDYRHNDWLVHLAIKFLTNDNATMTLIAHSPFQHSAPPKWVRAQHYRYKFTKIWSNSSSEGHWWKRKKIGSYLPEISLETIKDYAKMKQWPLLVKI